jgi:hypothetical protein
MDAITSRPAPRRSLLAAGLATAALAIPGGQRARAKTLFQRGMSGGGLAQLESGAEPRLANFGLFASALQLADGETLVLGRIVWIEAGTDLRLEALNVVQCIPIPNRTDGAEIRGRMSVNGDGDYPFVARAFDAGRPGSGLDRVEIEVNTAAAQDGAEPAVGDADFAYEAAATLVAGDMQWIIADIEVGS